jgi:hypothetical protein
MSSPPGITSQDTSGEAMVFVPTMPLPPNADPAIQNRLDKRASVTDETSARKLINVVLNDINDPTTSRDEIPLLKKELKQAELLLEFYKERSARGLKKTSTEPQPSALFPGKRLGGKGTRRKNRKHSKWTSSVTRKRSSMSASKGRRGKRSMTSSAKSLSSRRK